MLNLSYWWGRLGDISRFESAKSGAAICGRVNSGMAYLTLFGVVACIVLDEGTCGVPKAAPLSREAAPLWSWSERGEVLAP
jgi:hypothetical protein